MQEKISNEKRLDAMTTKIIQNTIFSSGRVEPLYGWRTIALSELFFSYYTPSEEEKAAVLTLREWMTVRKVEDIAGDGLEKICDGIMKAIDAWKEIIDHEKEKESPDLSAVVPPNITIPSELVSASKELTQKVQERLSGYVPRVAAAEQCLAEYIYQVVAKEEIAAEEDRIALEKKRLEKNREMEKLRLKAAYDRNMDLKSFREEMRERILNDKVMLEEQKEEKLEELEDFIQCQLGRL